MISKFISYLHKKPKHIRSLMALGTSLVLTVFIGILWVVSYTNYVNEKINSESAISFSSIFNKMKSSASVVAPTSTQPDVLDEQSTSSEDESVKATTSSEDLIQ